MGGFAALFVRVFEFWRGGYSFSHSFSRGFCKGIVNYFRRQQTLGLLSPSTPGITQSTFFANNKPSSIQIQSLVRTKTNLQRPTVPRLRLRGRHVYSILYKNNAVHCPKKGGHEVLKPRITVRTLTAIKLLHVSAGSCHAVLAVLTCWTEDQRTASQYSRQLS